TWPKRPGSNVLMEPPAAFLEISPAKVLHGAVRLQGLTSSPTPETQVRVACAAAGTASSSGSTAPITGSIGVSVLMHLYRQCPHKTSHSFSPHWLTLV